MLRTRGLEQVRVLGPADRDRFIALAEQDPVVLHELLRSGEKDVHIGRKLACDEFWSVPRTCTSIDASLRIFTGNLRLSLCF